MLGDPEDEDGIDAVPPHISKFLDDIARIYWEKERKKHIRARKRADVIKPKLEQLRTSKRLG